MLPPALVSVYREYKKDTNSIASWLASTAKECGYPPDLLSNTPYPQQQQQQQPAKTGRLKGKARTAAKKNKGKGTTPDTASVPRYIISINDFISLAEHISASKMPALSVPEAFFNTLHRVIAVRSSFSEKLSRHGAELDVKSDARHSYFVGILEKVGEVLKPFKPPTASSSSDAIDTLTNQFDALEVYEPSQDFLDAPDIPRPQAAGQDAAIYEADPSPTLEDALVAFGMMCKDLSEIRQFISSLWSLLVSPDDDEDDGVDPAVVAVVTNTAIEFAANIIEDMSPIFKEHGGAFIICQHYMARILNPKDESLEEFRKRMSESLNQDEHYDLSDSCYYFVGSLLHTLAAVPWQGSTGLYPEGHFGVYDPESDRTSKTGRQKYQEDTIIIGELYMEALALVHHIPDYPITDEFIRGVKEFKETNEIPFSLIFAAQVNLDIHHTVRGYAETSVATHLKRLSIMNVPLESTIDRHKDLKSPHWSSSDEDWLQGTSERIEWFLKDPLYEVKTLIAGCDPKAQELVRATEKHRLLRRSPIVAGLALYHHRTEVHELAVALTNAWGSIILPAHLYNAATEAGYSDCFWFDIEHLLALQGEEQFFVGGRPDNTADYVTRFMLQIGVSASVFTNRRRRSKKLNIDDFSRAGTRFLKPRTPIHDSLRARYQKNMNRMNWSPESIEEILSRAQMQQESTASRGVSSRLKNKRPGVTKAARISPTELLGHLGDAMQSEVQELAFPYMLMHITTWSFLKGMQEGYDPVLRDFFGPTYMQHEWQLPLIIGHILALADGVAGGDESVLELAGVMLDKMQEMKVLGTAATQMYRLCGREYEASQKQLEGLVKMSLGWMPDEDGDEDEDWEDNDEFDQD
ncbi:hypothetical protein CEP54_014559 [Fusarium duplospermum]|uniref:DUF6604 domain-containing protein n=1 Tax=Fusarium duplospermum TaxID=1325734 RepID=A0A428NV86_9HYPO|nr:hypothetical protein CEP54_014559 [Fusarium duplospermum]